MINQNQTIMKGKNLIFISQIKRDGSGTIPVDQSYIDMMQDDNFHVRCLSMTEGTYIASCINVFVVKLKTKTK